MNITKQDS